jgi:hypothetical protein
VEYYNLTSLASTSKLSCESRRAGQENMPTRKLEDSNIRKLTKVGNHSISVTLPIEIVRELGWKEKQKVVVKKVGKKLIIEDWPASTR